MLGTWRLQLRKAEHALRAGRLDEAYRLVDAPEVRSFRQARDLVGRVAAALVRRAQQRLTGKDFRRAWADLLAAERAGVGDGAVASVREQLTAAALAEVRSHLDSGQPEAALRDLGELSRYGAGSDEMRRIEEAACAWKAGRENARAGRFAPAVAHLQRAAALLPDCRALAELLRATSSARDDARPLEAELHAALSQEDWQAVLRCAEALLALAPEHGPARTARRRAWRTVGHVTAAGRTGMAVHASSGLGRHERFASAKPLPKGDTRRDCSTAGPSPRGARASGKRFLMWVDGVGGYLVCLADRVSLGQPAEPTIDVPILGDVSRVHAWIERSDEAYLLRRCRKTWLNGRLVADRALLGDNDTIELGRSVRLRFRQPCALSATARLELAAPQRLPLAVNAVLLMADTCILGPQSWSHVVASSWSEPLVLYRRGEELWCHGRGDLEIDGRPCPDRGRVTMSSRITGEGFSLTLEPLVSPGCRL